MWLDDAGVHRLRGLDGLRAVAIVGVLLYHADLASVPGGFLGVDVFFALSGYLITSLLLRQWEQQRRLDFVGFYRARARRLLPGLAAMLTATVVVTALAVPDAAREVRRDLLPALTYVSNWWSIGQHQSYFEQTGRPPLLLHLWSLAVEEQFYLLWPVVLLFLLRRWARYRDRGVLLARAAAGGAVASAVVMAVVAKRGDIPVPNDPSRAYFGTDTHASALLLGAALAALWPLHRPAELRREHRQLLEVGGAAGLVALVWCYATVSEYSGFLYRGGFLLVAALAVLVVAELGRQDSRLGRALGVAPMRWLGERSYGIYLWHWPVFELTRPALDVQESGLPNLALRLAMTLGLAELSWRYLEVPIRNGALARIRPALERWRSRPKPETARRLRVPAAALSLTVLLATGFAVDRPTNAVSVTAVAALPPASPGPDPDLDPPPLPALPPGAVTAWGDSVMLGARSSVRALLPRATVDAVVGRRAELLPDALPVLRRNGRLGSVVVLHIGDNGLFSRRTLDRALDQLADRQRVVLVTIRVPRRWQDPVNALLHDAAHSRPNVVLADWNHASANHPEYFVGDGIHLTLAGSRAFAAVVAAAIR